MGLISEIIQKVDSVTLTYTAQSYQAIVARHSTELHLMLVLYIALYGLAVLQGVIPGTTREMAKHILKAFIVYALATNWGLFTTFFYDVFTTGPDKLIGALTNGIKPSEQLGSIFDSGMICAARLFNKAGTFDFGIMTMGLLVALGTMFMTGFALFLIILSKLGLAVLLSIAPLFIALALWRGTQGLFQGWVNYLVNFALIPVITYGLLALIILIMEEAVKKIEMAGEAIQMEQVIPYVLIGSIAGFLFAQVNHIASSLGGGIALSTMNAVSRYVTQPAKQIMSKAGAKLSKNNKKPPPLPPKTSKPEKTQGNPGRQGQPASADQRLRASSSTNSYISSSNSSERSSSHSSSNNSELRKSSISTYQSHRPASENRDLRTFQRPEFQRAELKSSAPAQASKPSGVEKHEPQRS